MEQQNEWNPNSEQLPNSWLINNLHTSEGDPREPDQKKSETKEIPSLEGWNYTGSGLYEFDAFFNPRTFLNWQKAEAKWAWWVRVQTLKPAEARKPQGSTAPMPKSYLTINFTGTEKTSTKLSYRGSLETKYQYILAATYQRRQSLWFESRQADYLPDQKSSKTHT